MLLPLSLSWTLGNWPVTEIKIIRQLFEIALSNNVLKTFLLDLVVFGL